MSRRSSRATLFVARIETKALARMRSETLKSRSLGLDTALGFGTLPSIRYATQGESLLNLKGLLDQRSLSYPNGI